jgi:hypothetical protein
VAWFPSRGRSALWPSRMDRAGQPQFLVTSRRARLPWLDRRTDQPIALACWSRLIPLTALAHRTLLE